LLHQWTPKSTKACDAADLVDGLAILQNLTLRVAATAYAVSVGSVARARRLTPEARDEVRRGKRPLVLPHIPAGPPRPTIMPVPVELPVPSPAHVIADAQHRLNDLVREIGLNTVLDLLAATERVAA
jgi:hypothetical protein